MYLEISWPSDQGFLSTCIRQMYPPPPSGHTSLCNHVSMLSNFFHCKPLFKITVQNCYTNNCGTEIVTELYSLLWFLVLLFLFFYFALSLCLFKEVCVFKCYLNSVVLSLKKKDPLQLCLDF